MRTLVGNSPCLLERKHPFRSQWMSAAVLQAAAKSYCAKMRYQLERGVRAVAEVRPEIRRRQRARGCALVFSASTAVMPAGVAMICRSQCLLCTGTDYWKRRSARCKRTSIVEISETCIIILMILRDSHRSQRVIHGVRAQLSAGRCSACEGHWFRRKNDATDRPIASLRRDWREQASPPAATCL